ncbi:hypothetical protein P4392_24210, partial [Bacillus thuringiensis]|nr:hypothetical protein [Bacillus thuringiensis]
SQEDSFLKEREVSRWEMNWLRTRDGRKPSGSGAKKLNDLKIFFQTWPYWYYYLKKVRDQDGKRKHIQMETLSSRHDFVDCTLVPAVQPKLS